MASSLSETQTPALPNAELPRLDLRGVHPDHAAALLEIARALASAYTEAEIAQILVGQLFDALGAAAATAYLVTSPNTLTLAASRDLEASPEWPIEGEYPLSTCVRTGEAVFCATYEELVRRFPLVVEAPGAPVSRRQAVVVLPLRCEGKVVGAFGFGFEKPHAFGPEERDFLLTVKNHASVAMERARLRAAELRGRERLVVLARASRSFIAAPPDVTEVGRLVANEIATHLHCTCAVNVISQSGDTLEAVALQSTDPAEAKSALATMDRAPVSLAQSSMPARVAKSGQAIFLPQLDLEAVIAATPRAEYKEHLRKFPISAIALVPLRAHEKVIGVLGVSLPRGAKTFSADDRSMLEDLADLGALAIQNARSFEEAQRAIRGREDLLAVVSHDLRNPLSTLNLNVETMRRLTEGDHPRRVLSSMRRSLDRMEGLIQNLLDVAIIDAGRMELKREPLEVHEVIADAVAAHELLAVEQSVALVAENALTGTRVLCDRERVFQVMANLIGNAIKFTPAGGSVKIAAREDRPDVVFTVADTGQGISSDQLPHVFDRYWQAEKKKRGIGLGLSIAQGIVAAHGGKIWVESAPGQGSTFSFSLALAER
jgi:signal transduction histidine kinase